jgi:hypothetical protein
MAYTIPPDNRSVGSGNPPADMNDVSDVLTGSGAGLNVLNTALAGGADPTGTADSTAAFQAAIDALPAGGGKIKVPGFVPGTTTPAVYNINEGALQPVPGMWLTGDGYGCATVQSSSNALFQMDQGSGNQLDYVEIDHLTLSTTGAFPVFSGMYVTRSSVHHCYLQAHNAGGAIWYSNSGFGYMAECRFYENREQVYGTSRTVPAWYLNAGNTGTLFQVNDNHWHDNVCFDNNDDDAQWWYQVIYSGAFSGVTNNANTFNDIVFEFPCGGAIRLESASYTSIERITVEDLAALTVGSNPMVSIVKNSGGGASQANRVRSYSRRGGSNAGIVDIALDSNCVNTLVDSPAQAGGGTALTINLGSSSDVTAINIPSSAILSGYAGTGAVTAASAGFAPQNPTGTTSTTQVMMGLGQAGTPWVFTPLGTGIVEIILDGYFLNSTAVADAAVIGGRYGTGTAPINGAAVSGTSFGGNPTLQAASVSRPSAFSFVARVTMTAGTQYWIDVALAVLSGTAVVSAVQATVKELAQ